ncbi:hypothetical protein CLAFUW4_05876 [Fulvia fulva]|uniref:Uncharacterized protein n=1 Tax=Passalora fulva TaxID=5499 RepID=A0A9Q8LIC0_PASFU|nr:uncharacterized protein CLAFUR5_06020 [Fulvia fulva]KAK4624221.1 hypothetical protein CLAFUR4_05870 [Fulvia fulva]KAK4625766.1 hypothetical protein CLAFUR0_05883 [Fulvia fulva]UJO18019.1 hypothetical protein CLAFUR5_06020 [Fulvia fulva]WPV15479.1 hypothetical protein CLAFUW4_05876 [Fulvia fulva]WPV29708.1 hypothetical protein CLAFUW7_05874 [Fulvia fulva]
MASLSREMIFLTGAPAGNDLRWTETHLTPYFGPQFRRYLGDSIEDDSTTQITTTSATHPLAKWRSVPMPADASQQDQDPAKGAQFLSFGEGLNNDDDDLEHRRFLEHSLAILQDLDSSQIEVPDGTDLDDTNTMRFGSFGGTLTSELSLQESDASMVSTSSEPAGPQAIVFEGPLTDLRRIPNAQHLHAIQPQTMTVNILASVIVVKPTRTVQLRRRNAEMDIVEIIFGDETKANFTISFWLVPVDSQAARLPKQGSLRETVSQLRSGDVVIATHIALNDFNGNVYGNSLSKRTTRNNTTLIRLSGSITGLSAPAASKLSRVRNWSKQFVGGTKRASSPESSPGRDSKRRIELILPADTQPYG